jgi:serine/threonine-protein kinase mTOR
MTKSTSMERKNAAEQLMTNMKNHSTELINQCTLISKELIRTAILLEELWYPTKRKSNKNEIGTKQ